MTRLLPGLFVLVVLFIGCTDEFDLLNDEVSVADGYQKTVVAYANFSPSNEYHYIRVNRGFSAEDFYAGANNQDSIQFAPEEVDVRAYRIKNNDTIKTYFCRDTVIDRPESDYFYTGSIILYYFQEPNLLGNNTSGNIKFGLEVRVEEEIVTAQTIAIKDFNFRYPPNSINFPGAEFEGKNFRVEINKPENSQAYKVSGVGRYIEIIDNAGDHDTTLHTFSFLVGQTIETRPATGSGSKAYLPSTGIFYDALERDVLQNGDTVNATKRKFLDVAYKAIAGNSDIALAQQSNNQYTGFHDNETTVSNMVNGLGLFSAYNMTQTRYYELTLPTVDSIIALYGFKYKFRR